ncbi:MULTISPECIES: hypothetical protein [unclassified Duganella]|jgi:hypothetical protein|uniref:hypothetical protein n=1 Tax=unclassified Duganella TaxID=2636909 RepID=UPI00088DF275|nr:MULTISPECIES: hypothetical protein [unclassified Duganella]SDG93245.1 hypothetical protein SAMN05216320_108147 [Duganella sp. OV458]SDJ49155.1 hypothetical protein SAMN05428973_104300 [Duganella sp. OV510]
MLTVTLPDELEAEMLAAASRKGLSVEEYLAVICKEALSLEVDRERLQSYQSGRPGVSQDRADAWLSDLAAGKWSECPR